MTRDNADLEALGQFIREQRKTLGLTQTQLAERLGWVQERISLLENGKYGTPSLPGLARLAGALECPLAALLEVVGYASSGHSASDPQSHGNGALQYTLQRLLEIEATTLKDALNQASDQMAEAMGSDKVDAFIFDAPSHSLIALGTSNTHMGRLQHASGLERVPLANRGRVVDVYETGKTFLTGDAQHDPQIPIGVKETLGVQSMLAVPLRVDGGIRGVLVAESTQPDRFTEEEAQFFAAASRWVGLTARHAELNETMRQAAAEEARRLAADEVITALAHDLGNYLTPLKGRIDVLRRRLDRDGREREREDAQQAARAVSAMEQLVVRLLDIARLDQGLFSLALQPVDLAGLIERVSTDMRASHEALEVRVPDVLEVQADLVRLTEVISNLVTNAIHHSPNGTPVIVAAGTEYREDGQWAVVSVTDAGSGIAREMLGRVFDRYTSGYSSGLGLYLSRRLVEAHGGTLTVESVVGKGTTFWIALPHDLRVDGTGDGHVSDKDIANMETIATPAGKP